MSSEAPSYHMDSLHMMCVCVWRLWVYFYGLAVRIAIIPDDIHPFNPTFLNSPLSKASCDLNKSPFIEAQDMKDL